MIRLCCLPSSFHSCILSSHPSFSFQKGEKLCLLAGYLTRVFCAYFLAILVPLVFSYFPLNALKTDESIKMSKKPWKRKERRRVYENLSDWISSICCYYLLKRFEQFNGKVMKGLDELWSMCGIFTGYSTFTLQDMKICNNTGYKKKRMMIVWFWCYYAPSCPAHCSAPLFTQYEK